MNLCVKYINTSYILENVKGSLKMASTFTCFNEWGDWKYEVGYSRSKTAIVSGYCAFKCQMKIKCDYLGHFLKVAPEWCNLRIYEKFYFVFGWWLNCAVECCLFGLPGFGCLKYQESFIKFFRRLIWFNMFEFQLENHS